MLKNIKTVKSIKAQSFLAGGFHGHSKYPESFSVHQKQNTRNSTSILKLNSTCTLITIILLTTVDQEYPRE